MSTFTFAPQQFPQQQRETQRNYVFVDEHNRHKRLKVMRACEGCRRRKIKCDAATTNTWPCSACIKLKLHCVRPNGFDTSATETSTTPIQDQSPLRQQQQSQQQAHQQQYFAAAGTVQDGFTHGAALHSTTPKNTSSIYQQPGFTQSETNLYQYGDLSAPHHNMHYTTVPPPVSIDDTYATGDVFTPPMRHGSHAASSPTAFSTDSQAADLSSLLGSLKVNEAGTAPYLRNKASFLRHEEEPTPVEETDQFDMAKFATAVRGKIRIPPALMPDEETAMHYFDLYFSHVHPWVPVLNKSQFYQQWHTNRDAISPLILEGLFAIGGKLADEPAQGQQWLALAATHADSFMDVPRLSTLQALLILIKAREATPKKGYFYRSWMAVVQCVQMGKDLELDEHYAEHKAGRGCDSSPSECQLKTRIWQVIFDLEVMIGSPQGRTDLQVTVDQVDLSIPRPMPGTIDDGEYLVSRNWVYFSRLIRCVSVLNAIYAKIKKKPEWGLDPELVQLNPTLNSWLTELPTDLAVTFPPDNSPPWLSSAFIGHLHCYHYLVYVILHRPQLAFCDPSGSDGKWRQHMMICYSSARALCRLQEAILKNFGLNGLASMQRGLSFHVYCALSCIVLHLVAMTSPDPDLNTHSREFFERHMRLLETVMAAWPMPEMQRQVDAVREAFSADIRKPFALKPSFPYGSPSLSNAPTPPRSSPSAYGGGNGMNNQQDSSNSLVSQLSFTSQPITPPVSAGPVDGKNASPMMMFSAGPNVSMPPAMSMPADAPAWNPARIFEQWNTSFGTPQVQSNPSPQSQASTGLSVSPSSGPEVQQALDELTAGVNHDPLSAASSSNARQQLSAQQQFAPSIPFITPAMWQESVASVYESGTGLKRSWDYDGGAVSKR